MRDEANAGGAAGGGGAGGGAGSGASGTGTGGEGAGSGAGAGGGTGAGAGGEGGSGQPDGGIGSPSPYRPSGLPDHYAGSSDKDTIDKLFSAVNGFRTKQGEAGAVPTNGDGYSFEASDALKPFVANFDKDPVYKAVRDIAHKAGLTDKQFKTFLPGVLEHFVSAELVGAPVDPKAMLRGLAPANLANGTDAEKETAGAKRVTDTIAWIDGAKANNTLPPDVAEFLSAGAASDPRAIATIDWLRGEASEPKPAMNGGNNNGGQSDADLERRNNDPRNVPGKPEYDAAFRAETDRMFKQRYG
ncbi:hypothetical protein [Bradyrhizobium elkanii]|uniref:Uncharacterized protein n=1 Tax=Bradyrhizobium elkanii TaxID=29448 RepID=A0A8I1YE73_BRAEL|nr:hypothetical protein [Bradyrhizobium elkanii]MBP1296621.1 hypothetical protein [Bradyrhizobium elkanii]